VGFGRIEVVERTPFSIDDAAHYPLFTPEVIGLMHELLEPADKEQVAIAITVTARRRS
jgi:arsenite methyltransferase